MTGNTRTPHLHPVASGAAPQPETRAAGQGARAASGGGGGRGFRPFKPPVLGSPKTAIKALLRQVGGPKEAALLFGVSHTTVYAYQDEAEPEHMPWPKVVALSGPDAPAIADYMAARCGGVFVPMAQDCGAAPLLLAEVARQQGEMMAVLVQALADGRLTTTEAQRGIAEINDAMQAQARLRARLQAIVDHAGIDGDQTATGGEG